MFTSSANFVKAKRTFMSAFQKFMKNISECTVMAKIRHNTGTNSSRSKIFEPKFHHIAVTVKNKGKTSALRYFGFCLRS